MVAKSWCKHVTSRDVNRDWKGTINYRFSSNFVFITNFVLLKTISSHYFSFPSDKFEYQQWQDTIHIYIYISRAYIRALYIVKLIISYSFHSSNISSNLTFSSNFKFFPPPFAHLIRWANTHSQTLRIPCWWHIFYVILIEITSLWIVSLRL